VGSGVELHARGDPVEQVEQLPALFLVELVCHLSVELLRLPFGPLEELLSGGRQVEIADTPVAGVRLPLEQAALLELVDDGHHPAGGYVQPLGESVLRLAVAGRDRAEECELAGLQLERPSTSWKRREIA
jgi:hypothetical protein